MIMRVASPRLPATSIFVNTTTNHDHFDGGMCLEQFTILVIIFCWRDVGSVK